MKCYICNNEAEAFSDKFVEKVCLGCDTLLSESMTKSAELKKDYAKAHALCPSCGAEGFISTLMAFTFDVDHPENYKDLNYCTCSSCGNKHTRHERTPKTN